MEKMIDLARSLNPTELHIAYDLIEGRHQKTPIIRYGVVHSDGFRVQLYAKMDTLNPGGSFKDRGSLYAIDKAIMEGRLTPGDTVVAASAGNHAKGVAKAAGDYALNAIIFMSDETPKTKIRGTEDLGATVQLVEGRYEKAAEEARGFAEEDDSMYIPAFEHSDIITGQSTVVTEALIQLFRQGIRPDFFIYPVGGGGLANGSGFAARYYDQTGLYRVNGFGSKIFNYGVQARNFNTMVRSFREGHVVQHEDRGETIADGICVADASEAMLLLSKGNIDDMFDVTEEEIRAAIRHVYDSPLIRQLQKKSHRELELQFGFHANHVPGVPRLNIVEGAAAAAFACAFAEDKIPYEDIARSIHPRKEIIGVVIASGNNIDQGILEEILDES
jgi:threonine dehydratase